jgi:hypothetical protein
VLSLETHHRRRGAGTHDSVDRASVDVVVPERHLQRGDGRAACGMRGRRGQKSGGCDGGCELDVAEAWHHSNEGSAGFAEIFSRRFGTD